MIAPCLLAILLVNQAPFPAAEPKDVGIDPAALERLKVRAEKSDAVVIVKDGKLIADWTFGKPAEPIEAMSATKSIVNLAIGRLIDQGKIKSMDQPVSDFYPEWRQGRKRQITVRHLLNHTSGLENKPTSAEIEASPDFVQFALAADLSDDPGTRFSYNNKAVNLLAGLVERVTGRRMDVFIGEEIFKPMGITDFHWSLDRAGNAEGMAGLQIRAIDLAKIGQMMLDGGKWKDARIVSEEWVRISTAQPGQPLVPTCGLLWWLIPDREAFTIDDAMIADLKAFGLTEESARKAEALRDKEFSFEGVWAALRPITQRDDVLKHKLKELDNQINTTGKPRPKRVPSGGLVGYEAQGYRGQFLVVIPKHRIVAVRQLRAPRNGADKTDDFGEFRQMVRDLVPADPQKAKEAAKP